MRAIAKEKEPRELAEYRCKPDAVYDGPEFTVVKNAIRDQLLREQGYLCAYCMKRISSDFGQMKVEHWHCQDNYPVEQLSYQNMLGVCLGNQGSPPDKQTCDTRKGNADIKYNPANPSHRIASQIRFLRGGKIESGDSGFDFHLNNVLNLNYSRLVDNRRAVWDAVEQQLSNRLSKKPGTRTPAEKVAEIEKLLGRWSEKDGDGRLQEYCAVAIYFLRKKQRSSPI